MSISRKKFLKQSLLATAGLSLFDFMQTSTAENWHFHLDRLSKLSLPEADEDFWKFIREQYIISPDITNMNNGGVSPQPIPVQKAHVSNYTFCNEGPSYYMWRVLDQRREPLRERLATMAGCSKEEIAINRNTTEGLNTIIFGLPLQKGDEVVLTKYDYPNMINAWRQREKRDGIVLKWIDFDFPLEDDSVILKKFSEAITARTKIVHITHLMNWTGQLLPAKKIIALAHSKGAETIVDAAHTFAHIEFSIKDLNCDYLATSLHKWLGAPFGTGMMYVKKEKIKKVWSLLGSYDSLDNDIRKFETIGTRSFAAEMAIANAIDFHHLIGAKRKEARLRFLKNYWCEKVKNIRGVKLYTSLQKEYSGALATFAIEGRSGSEIEQELFQKSKIHSSPVQHEKLNGVRITPHVYTSLAELDLLVETIKKLTP